MHQERSSLAITLAVWHAIFLRESLGRFFARRGAWFWLLAEPIFHMSYMVILYSVISVHSIGGIKSAVWALMGLLAFFCFKRTAVQVSQAIAGNLALFAFRQVKPIDMMIVRALLEGLVIVVVYLVLSLGFYFLGLDLLPDDGLLVIAAFFGLWLLGFAFGVVLAVMGELMPESAKMVSMLLLPLYWLSCVMFPLASVPEPYRHLLLFNPVVHGIELCRVGMASYYHQVPALSLSYLYGCSLVLLYAGLLFYRRFSSRLGVL